MNVQLLSIVSALRHERWLTVLLAVLAVFFSGISPAKDYPALDVPADIALKVNKASSPQSPYSSGHSVNQAIDGSLESANWHAPGARHVEGEFELAEPSTLHYVSFSGANFNEVSLSVMTGSSWRKLGKFNLGGSRIVKFKTPLQKVQKIRMEVDYPEGTSPSFTVREVGFYQKPESGLNGNC